jgi:hypothetical protein
MYGCSAHRMGVVMSKLFASHDVSLGPNGEVGRKQTLYCVWPEPFNRFFFREPKKSLRELWRKQRHERLTAETQAKRARHVETLDYRRTAS